MDPLTLALLGGSLVGGLFKKKEKSTQQQTSSSTPTFAPEFGGLRDRLIRGAMGGLGQGFGLAHGMTNQALDQISSGGAAAETGLRAKLAASGIRGPAAGAALGSLGNRVFGEQAGVLGQEPMLAHDLNSEAIQRAMGVLSMGRGTSTTGTGSTVGTAGGGLGGGFADLAEMMGFLSSQGMLRGGGKKKTAGA